MARHRVLRMLANSSSTAEWASNRFPCLPPIPSPRRQLDAGSPERIAAMSWHESARSMEVIKATRMRRDRAQLVEETGSNGSRLSSDPLAIMSPRAQLGSTTETAAAIKAKHRASLQVGRIDESCAAFASEAERFRRNLFIDKLVDGSSPDSKRTKRAEWGRGAMVLTKRAMAGKIDM